MLNRNYRPAVVPLYDVAHFVHSSDRRSQIAWYGTHLPDRDRAANSKRTPDHDSFRDRIWRKILLVPILYRSSRERKSIPVNLIPVDLT